MKKLAIVLFASLIFLLATSLISFSLSFLSFNNVWTLLVIGSAIIIVSIILLIIYLKTKKRLVLYLIFAFNLFAMGFLIRTWHMYKGYNLDLYVLFLISIACTIYLLIFYLLSYIPLFSKYFKTFIFCFLILSIISYIILIFSTKTNYLSTYGYYMIIEMGFILALSVYTEDINSLFKAISFSTFLVIIVAIIMIIIMLDGDVDFDLIDGNLDFMPPKKQANMKTIQ